MIIHATFIGHDGSCGYKKGVRYTIHLIKKENNNTLVTSSSHEEVEYESIISFLNNWDNIKNAN